MKGEPMIKHTVHLATRSLWVVAHFLLMQKNPQVGSHKQDILLMWKAKIWSANLVSAFCAWNLGIAMSY